MASALEPALSRSPTLAPRCLHCTRTPGATVARCSDGQPLPVLATPGGKQYVISEEGCEYKVVGTPGPRFPFSRNKDHVSRVRLAGVCALFPTPAWHAGRPLRAKSPVCTLVIGPNTLFSAMAPRANLGAASFPPLTATGLACPWAPCTAAARQSSCGAGSDLGRLTNRPCTGAALQAFLYVDGQCVGYSKIFSDANPMVREGFCMSGEAGAAARRPTAPAGRRPPSHNRRPASRPWALTPTTSFVARQSSQGAGSDLGCVAKHLWSPGRRVCVCQHHVSIRSIHQGPQHLPALQVHKGRPFAGPRAAGAILRSTHRGSQ